VTGDSPLFLTNSKRERPLSLFLEGSPDYRLRRKRDRGLSLFEFVRKRGLSLLLALAWATFAAAGPKDEIAKLLNDQAAAWTRGDLDAFCAVYADDATFISPSGMTSGRKAVLDRYRKKYVDKAGMGTLTLDVQEVRDAGESGASVVAQWTLTWPDKPKSSGLTLLVFAKTASGWRIVQDASM